MKLIHALAALGFVPFITACESLGVQRTQAAFQLGSRHLSDDDFWTPLDTQTSLSLDFALLSETGIGGEFGLAYSSDSAPGGVGSGTPVEGEASVNEFYGGIRKAWPSDSGFQPFVGAGLSFVIVDLAVTGGFISEGGDDSSFGVYLRGGVDYFFTSAFFLGLDLRYLYGTDIDLGSLYSSSDVDGPLLGVRVGFAF